MLALMILRDSFSKFYMLIKIEIRPPDKLKPVENGKSLKKMLQA